MADSRHPSCLGVLLCLFALGAVPVSSQDSLQPLQPSNTSTPADTFGSLIAACNELHLQISAPGFSPDESNELLPAIERILDCLDLSELPGELRNTAGVDSALFLKEVLDRIELPSDDEIPREAGSDADVQDMLLQWRVPNTRIEIRRVESGPRRGAFLFTPETVRSAAQFYRMVKSLPYRTEGRPTSPDLYTTYAAMTKQKPTRSADTSSPRGTLTLFLDSCNELHGAITASRHFDRSDPQTQELGNRIVSCLDTSQLPAYTREYFDAEAAVCLKEILDRIRLPSAEEIPGSENVESADGGEPLTRWQVPRSQLVITRVAEGPRRGEFLFSADTVARAPEIYTKIVTLPYRSDERPVSEGFYEWWLSSPGNPTMANIVDQLPAWFQHRRLGIAIWQWCGLLLAVLCSCGLIWVAFWGVRRRSIASRQDQLGWYWLSLSYLVVALLVPLGLKYFLWEYLTIRGTASYVSSFCADLLFLIALVALLIGSSSRIAETIIALPQISANGLDGNLTRIICRVMGIAAAAIVFLEGGRYLGFPLSTLIASAGIGGLAIALSAQGLIKGLFGTVTILLDRPFNVGERVIVKGHDGFVEEIGLRSTKIRALSKQLIAIPNDQIADAEVQNFGSQFLRRTADIRIPLDTPRAQVEQAVASIREILTDHEGMHPQFPPRVHLKELGAEAFEIRFDFWFTPPDYWKFQAFSEQVNLAIFCEFERHGIQFSLPLRHSFWKHDDAQGPLEVAMVDDGSA